jgi:purine catabolism regulator
MYRSVGITIRDLLKLGILKDAKNLSGSAGMDRKITKVNVMEVPDILDWVQPGEFLLTTAYSIKDDIIKLKELIPELNKRGLAGLGIKTKRYIKEIPEIVLKTARDLDFPLIEIPYDVSYADIIMPVLTDIVNSQTTILKQIDGFNSRLMNVMLKGGSLKEIANAIHGGLGISLAIYENIFKSYEIICPDDQKEEIESIIVAESNRKRVMNYKDTGKNSYIRTRDMLGGKSVERIMIPICTEDRNYGNIFIWQDQKELSPVELSVMESAAPLIALDLLKKLSIYEIENKHKIEFFDDLLSSDEGRQRKALERSTFFNFDKNLSYSVIIITIRDIDSLMKLTPNNTNYLHHLNNKLMSIVERLSKSRKEKIIYGNKSDRMIILYSSELGKNKLELKNEIFKFCEEVFAYAEIESIKENISIGIGRNYSEVGKLWMSNREAQRAVENLIGSREGHPIHYDDLGIYRILSYEELKPELFHFYKEILEPLVKYDREKDSDLVKTLKKYFECRSNLKKVSEEMYTHYNTIIYRMQRIKEITGINLEDPNERLNLEISLKIYDILKTEQL